MYLERISLLEKHFNTCEDGKYFLLKTGPLWNSFTQCIFRKSSIFRLLSKSSDTITLPEGYTQLLHEQAKNNESITYSSKDINRLDSVLWETLTTGSVFFFYTTFLKNCNFI